MHYDKKIENQAPEEILEYFAIESTGQMDRLQILRRFHQYLGDTRERMPQTEQLVHELHSRLLMRAYQIFAESSHQAEFMPLRNVP